MVHPVLGCSGYAQRPEDARVPIKLVIVSGNVLKKTYAHSATQFKNLTHISPKEAAFIMKHPIDAYSIHEASQKALRATWDNLKSSNNFQDDSADAFRHFYWSAVEFP